MGLQSSYNNNLTGLALVASAAHVSRAIREAGFNDYNQLNAAIKELEIKIAEAKDDGREYAEMEKLLQKYIAIKEQADKEEAKRKENQTTAIWVSVIFGVLFFVVFLSVIFSLL